MTYPVYPLPEGHMYANTVSKRTHSGDDPIDRVWLASAQRRLRFAWKATGVIPSGHYDAATMEAVEGVQRAHELPVTGWLDEDTWGVLWEAPPTGS